MALDKPLLTDAGTLFPYERSTRFLSGAAVLRWVASLLSPRGLLLPLAALALVGALLATVALRSSAAAGAGSAGPPSVRTLLGIAQGRVQRFLQETVAPLVKGDATAAPAGTPVEFAADRDGFGVCTLVARKPLGRTSYVQYDFALPRPDNVLPLRLGQELELCCLDDAGAVSSGRFHVYQPTAAPTLGRFSLLVPALRKDLGKAIGEENAHFARVLKQELKVGDEVAIRPGRQRLEYKGQFLPVTDMVYVCFGTGVVPVLEQVRAVLPADRSSVTSATVVWVNEQTTDFDVIAELLEKEYFMYSDKLSASCIVENAKKLSSLSESVEINSSIPDFRPGTMAVLSGPAPLVQKAKEYLEDRGYPADTMCVL